LFQLPRLSIHPLTTTVFGAILVIGSLVWYQIGMGMSVVGSQTIGMLDQAAYTTIALVFIGLTLAFAGITRLLQKASSEDNPRNRSQRIARLSSAIANRRSAKIFLLSSVSYGLLFGLVSSTLIIQPGISFSQAYGVRVPSLVPVLCCGAFGEMPQLVVYATQQLALLIIPVNIILLFAVSWLVGLNASIASFAYANRPRHVGTKWISGFGAAIGLFTVCPTCAGFFFLSTLSVTGAVALALSLSSLQAVFIGIGIPILAVTPIVTASRIPEVAACRFAKTNERRTRFAGPGAED